MEFRLVYMPYCLEKLKDGSWVVLNRLYKPIGQNSYEWVDYSYYSVNIKGLTNKRIEKIAVNIIDQDNRYIVYLYNDSCIPTSDAKNMKSYLDKLALLAKLKIY